MATSVLLLSLSASSVSATATASLSAPGPAAPVELRVYDEPYVPYYVLLRFGKRTRVETKLALDSVDTTEIELWGSPRTWHQSGDLRLLDQAAHPRCPRPNERAYLMYSTTLKRDLFVCGGGAARRYGVHGSLPIGARGSLALLYPSMRLEWLRLRLGECGARHTTEAADDAAPATSDFFEFPCAVSDASRAGGVCSTNATVRRMDGTEREYERAQVFDESKVAVFDEETYTSLSRDSYWNDHDKWISVWGRKVHSSYFKNQHTLGFDMRSAATGFGFGHSLLRTHSLCVSHGHGDGDTGERRASLVAVEVNTEVDSRTCVFVVVVLLSLFFLNRGTVFAADGRQKLSTIALECVYHGVCASVVASDLLLSELSWEWDWLRTSAAVSSALATSTLLTYHWGGGSDHKSNFQKLAHQIVRDTHCVVALPFLLSGVSSDVTVCLARTILVCFGCYDLVFLLSRALADLVYTADFRDLAYWVAFAACASLGVHLYARWVDVAADVHSYLLDQDTPFDAHTSMLTLLLAASELCTSVALAKDETTGRLQLRTNSHVVAKHTLLSMKRASQTHARDAELGKTLIARPTGPTGLAGPTPASDGTRNAVPVGARSVTRRRIYPAMSARAMLKPLHQ